ncbi:MAG: acyltransferase [Vampirovibrionales bacterium]
MQPLLSLTDTHWLESLKAVYAHYDASLQENYHRSLPFQDALFDRWERAKQLGFGEGTSIYNSALVMGDVTVGEHTWIGPNTLLDGTGGSLRIGSHCSISAGVHVYTHNSVMKCLTLGQATIEKASTTLGDGVYVGAHSIIRDGVTIGNRVIIGANSFVNHTVPDHTIVAGSPATVIGKVIIEPNGTVRCCYPAET